MGRKRAAPFDPKTFLAIVDGGKQILKCRKKQALFSQGEPTDAVFYLLAGKVKLTALSSKGKEAVIAILGQGEFFGEACLTGQLMRTVSAMALEESTIMRIDKVAMIRILREEPTFAELFISHLLSRNIRIEEDLVINSLIPVKSDSLGFYCCSPILGKKIRWRNSSFQKSARRLWPIWSAPRDHESVSF